ncbi:hypothetical protein PQX77_014771 [Marasmius sp. AFHP31]|nr:hypothetical protein PQX77_014771 [Marasmius sp. AFHP31]
MATRTVTEPKQLEADLRDLATALYTIDDEHPLLELADDACTRTIALIERDPDHTVGERGYRDFYRLTQTIVKATRYKWEDALNLAGGVTSMISTVPGLTLLKPVGTLLGQFGERVKTTHGNKDECAELLRLATRILAGLSGKLQVRVQTQPNAINSGHYEVAEDTRRGIGAFQRTLIRIRDCMTKLEHKSRVKRFRRLAFANTTKEDLASFRKELGDAQMEFMTSNVYAIRLELCGVHDAVRVLDNKIGQ